jgi:hypothetical protein
MWGMLDELLSCGGSVRAVAPVHLAHPTLAHAHAQHTSAYVSIRQHTSAYVSIPTLLAHPTLAQERVGRSRGLHPEHALAFAMAAHQVCACGPLRMLATCADVC